MAIRIAQMLEYEAASNWHRMKGNRLNQWNTLTRCWAELCSTPLLQQLHEAFQATIMKEDMEKMSRIHWDRLYYPQMRMR